MKRNVVFLALLGWVLTGTGQAGYTIDGSLADWGVTPFSDWVPNGTADYTQTDNVNLYEAAYYDERFDMEAMYFDDDADNFYFGVVTSYQPLGVTAGGDLGLDLNGDMSISQHGIVTGLEYAMHVGTGFLGQVIYGPIWDQTQMQDWPDGWQGSPYKASGGTPVGSGTVVMLLEPHPGTESVTYVLEASVPRNIFPNHGGDLGDLVGIHLTMWCGNDSINLIGDIDNVVPAPGAVLLGSLGVGLIGWLRRRGTLL